MQWRIASRVATSSIAPDAPMAWPCIDLVELIASFSACVPNTARIAAHSVGSFVNVPVPWALIYRTASGANPASVRARWIASAAPALDG